MRVLAQFLAILFLVSGCVTHRPSPTKSEISQKRAEAEELEEELAVVIRSLDHLEKIKATEPSLYPLDAQERELDYRISVIRKAKDDLMVELKRMQERYNGPY